MSGETKPREHSLARGHEERDVSFRPIVLAALGLAVLILVSVAAMRLLFVYNLDREARRSPPANPLAAASGPRLPPEPRLLPKPIEQLQQLRAEEKQTLETYGWVDRSKGIVRIPVERAMELVARKGLPDTGTVPRQPGAASGAAEGP
jgi:hypothetical protein